MLVIKGSNGIFRTVMYRKQTHKDRYLHANSHHCPSQKMGLLHTMATRTVRIANDQRIDEENTYLRQSLQNTGYLVKNISQAIRRAQKIKTAVNI